MCRDHVLKVWISEETNKVCIYWERFNKTTQEKFSSTWKRSIMIPYNAMSLEIILWKSFSFVMNNNLKIRKRNNNFKNLWIVNLFVNQSKWLKMPKEQIILKILLYVPKLFFFFCLKISSPNVSHATHPNEATPKTFPRCLYLQCFLECLFLECLFACLERRNMHRPGSWGISAWMVLGE